MKVELGQPLTPQAFIQRNDAHVVPVKDWWAVKTELQPVYSGVFPTQVEAIGYAIGLARMAASSVIIHNQKGQFRAVWSYDGPNVPRIMQGR